MHDNHADQIRRTIAAYDAHAASYAERNASLVGSVAALLARFVAGLPANARVLDVGCGPGRDAAYLAAQGCRVTGLDLSRGQLLCVPDAVTQAVTGFVQGDMTRLPFAARTFDGLWACASLLHLPRELVPGVLAELRRIAAPDALLYVGMKRGEGERWEPSPVLAGELRYFTYYAPDELAALVRAAGFRVDALVVDAMWVNVFARAV